MIISLVATQEADVEALKHFVATHPDVREIDPAFAHQYDANGNFKEIPMHLAGETVSPEYLDWYFNIVDADIDETKDISLETLKNRLTASAQKTNHRQTK
jgi:hypothetical protein